MTASLACLFIAAAAVPPVEAPLPVETVVRRHAVRFLVDKPHGAIVIGVTARGRQRVWGFGSFKRNGRTIAPDGQSIYEIGSITKTFTGTILADLAQSGTVSLDDPVRRHLPSDWPMPTRDGRDMSLLHLSTHTSSLPRMPPGFDGFLVLTRTADDPYSAYRAENLQITLSQVELSRPIGSRHAYSNLGVGLLGIALAHADQQPDVDTLFARRLIEPLGLTETTFALDETAGDCKVPGFKSDGTPAHAWNFDCLKACGGLNSTADDMLAYAEAAMGVRDTPLCADFALAMQPWRETCDGERSIGLGWYVQQMSIPAGVPLQPETRLVWHGGATGGYRSFLGLMPERKAALIVLSNSTADVDPSCTWPVLKALLREIGTP